MINIHDSNLITTTKEDKAIAQGLSGSSREVSSSSSFSMCSSEDASSSSSSNGAFDDLPNLISQLPIIHVKKGLSKFYKGKSQSFKSLTNVTRLKDLVKKESRMKQCRNSKGILRQRRKRAYSANATISIKGTKTS